MPIETYTRQQADAKLAEMGYTRDGKGLYRHADGTVGTLRAVPDYSDPDMSMATGLGYFLATAAPNLREVPVIGVTP